MLNKPVCLLIMDGFGITAAGEGNAISLAKTPNLDKLFSSCPNSQLQASGEYVGLPDGQMGNSEVGHTNLGAGRIVMQELPRISKAAREGKFPSVQAYRAIAERHLARGGRMHIMGLLSDGGVHSHINHMFALIDALEELGITEIYVHAFMDGRDVPPKSGAGYIKQLEEKCASTCARIATVSGRFYAMDRDKRWDRIDRALDAIVRGTAPVNTSASAAMEESYEKGITDEFVEPVIIDPNGTIHEGDGIIFANFRPDRAREITRALTRQLPSDCPINITIPECDFVCTTQYDETLDLPIAFPPEKLEKGFGEWIASKGKSQLRIAETEKYAHVTFFFNGGVEAPFEGEDRVLIDSPKEFPTYDLIPEMSARKVAEACSERIRTGKYDAVICNLANCDMVGHTGVIAAAVEAVETVDECVGKIAAACEEAGMALIVTADHGNADEMLASDGTPNTAHTTNPVPVILQGCGDVKLRTDGVLADVAPTMLEIMGVEKPEEMTGASLISK